MGKPSLSDDSRSFLAAPHLASQSPPVHTEEVHESRSSWSRSWLKWKRHCNKFWIYELTSSAISILLFIGIIVLLAERNGQEYGDATLLEGASMKRPILYTYLSLLSAFMRAAMLLPVATAISQLTWSWLRSQRRLIDIERFDEASRGMIGSLELIWTVKFRHLVAVGAAIMVLALPVDAFIQNSVMIPLRRQPNTKEYPMTDYTITDKTTIPKATFYNSSQLYDTTASSYASLAMIDAMLMGVLYFQTAATLIPIKFGTSPAQCPTGYCDFGRYQTLGIASICYNRTADIVISEGEDPYITLPDIDGLALRDGTDQLVIKSYDKFSNGSTKTRTGPLIARTVMIISNWDYATEAIALDCATTWSVQTYRARSDDDTSLAILDSLQDYQKFDYDQGQNVDEPEIAFKMWPTEGCVVNNRTFTEEENPALYAKECVFRVTNTAHEGMQKFLLDEDDGFNGLSRTLSSDKTTNQETYTRLNIYARNILEMAYQSPSLTNSRIPILHATIAIFMTRFVRFEGGIKDDEGILRSGNSTGWVYENVYYYKIAWERLIMPAIIVLGSTIFVVATAFVSRGDLQWRRSNIPLLFHGLSEEDKELGRYKKDLVDMEIVAQDLKVKMVEVSHGPRLSSSWPSERA